MKEIIIWSISTWSSYWGNGFYHYLLLLSVLYLIGWKRKNRSSRQLLSFFFAVLFLFLFPFTAYIIQTCIGQDVYWRVLWLLPTAPLIALACAEFPEKIPSGFLRSGLVLVFAALIIVCSNSLLHSGEYTQVFNYQKVPDEVAHICSLIQDYAGDQEIRLAADEHVATYVRVYDPSISMPYGRRCKGALDKNSRDLYQEINSEKPDYAQIARLARIKKCNFISVAIPEDFDPYEMENLGYIQVGTVNQYGIFQACI